MRYDIDKSTSHTLYPSTSEQTTTFPIEILPEDAVRLHSYESRRVSAREICAARVLLILIPIPLSLGFLDMLEW